MADKVWAVKGAFGLVVVVEELVRLAERQIPDTVVMAAPEKALQYLAVQ